MNSATTTAALAAFDNDDEIDNDNDNDDAIQTEDDCMSYADYLQGEVVPTSHLRISDDCTTGDDILDVPGEGFSDDDEVESLDSYFGRQLAYHGF